ncbi:MAG: hypothetical protein D6790_14615 [Caldilineae bacterium]|nr:MAG: hypothetical protein D6790_14615 [Caldilineae bacterium]
MAGAGEDAVGGGQFEQAHFAAAQGEGQAVIAGEAADPRGRGQLLEGGHTDALQHDDRRDVVAVSQGFPHRDRPVIAQVVIGGHVCAAFAQRAGLESGQLTVSQAGECPG